MKKLSLILIGSLTISIALAGCGSKTTNSNVGTPISGINNENKTQQYSSETIQQSNNVGTVVKNRNIGSQSNVSTKTGVAGSNPSQLINNKFKTYTNERFEYSVNYPSDWIMGDAPANDDGIEIHDNNGNAMTMYASNDSNSAPLQQNFTTTSGAKGNFRISGENKKNYALIIKAQGIEYNFSMSISNDYYNKHKDDLFSIVKSFAIPSEPKG